MVTLIMYSCETETQAKWPELREVRGRKVIAVKKQGRQHSLLPLHSIHYLLPFFSSLKTKTQEKLLTPLYVRGGEAGQMKFPLRLPPY